MFPILSVIFSLGFLALVAQTLLFRDFLSVFAGHELAVGWFFASWLTGIAVGAWAGAWRHRRLNWLLDHFEQLPVLYLPAFILQQFLILNARNFGAVNAYEMFPWLQMLAVGLVVNAPTGLVTGFLFTLACRWGANRFALPVARVYIVEALGSCAGGLAVTVLLAAGYPGEVAFLGCALAPAAAMLFFVRRRRQAVFPIALIAGLAIMLVAGGGAAWSRHNGIASWRQFLPESEYRGSFHTPQARYLYGEKAGQFNVLEGASFSETLPDAEHAAEVVALHLAQHPTARRVLVIGPGALPVCLRLLALPGIQAVTWLHPDPAYPRQLRQVLPAAYRAAASRVELPSLDAREFLRQPGQPYDLVILHVPDVTSLVLNRYCTREFYGLIKARLAPAGLLGVRITGGENYLGGELVDLGASAYATLKSVFRQLTLKPGDESWVLASDSGALSDDRVLLRQRFGAIPGAAAVYPPEGLMSLYPPDRIYFQKRFYEQAVTKAQGAALINTDRHPQALVFNLLLLAKQSGGSVAFRQAADRFRRHAGHLFLLVVGIYLILQLIWRYRPFAGRGPSSAGHRIYDSHFLVFTTGFAGMALSVLLLFLYQSYFGSVFLHIGLISALFMLGLTLGGIQSEALLTRQVAAARWLFPAALVGQLLLLALVAILPTALSRGIFLPLFLLAGFFQGIYVPLAGSRLKSDRVDDAAAGSAIEGLDNGGGALGSLVAGLLLLPLLGTGPTLLFLAGLLVLNVLMILPETPAAAGNVPETLFERRVRATGYGLTGIAIFVMAGSLLLHQPGTEDQEQKLRATAETMMPGANVQRRFYRATDGLEHPYFVLQPAPKPAHYLVNTAGLVPAVSGYGGPLSLALLLDDKGTLADFRILDSHETPSYLDRLTSWRDGLKGRSLLEHGALREVEAVTGATLSSRAILQLLQTAGPAFATQILHRTTPESVVASRAGLDWGAVLMVLLLVAAVVLRFRPSRWGRHVFLALVIAIAGVYLNAQFSVCQVGSLLTLNLPQPAFVQSFLLMVGIPLAVLLLGNQYCGWLCPFGALQELLGDLGRGRWLADPRKTVWKYGRLVKYLLLFVFILYLVADNRVMALDPLVTFFSGQLERRILALAVLMLGLSLFFSRFWCRNLCPAGAFLALLGGLRPFRRRWPAVLPAQCDYGVCRPQELDCIQCDRCRLQRETLAGNNLAGDRLRRGEWIFLAVVALTAVFLLHELFTEKSFKAPVIMETERPQAVQIEPMPSEPVGPEAKPPEAVRPIPVQPAAVKPAEAVRPKTEHPEAAKAEPVKPETVRPEPIRAEIHKEAAQPKVVRPETEQPAAESPGAARIRALIEQKKLSGHEAMYYRKIVTGQPPASAGK